MNQFSVAGMYMMLEMINNKRLGSCKRLILPLSVVNYQGLVRSWVLGNLKGELTTMNLLLPTPFKAYIYTHS